MMGTPPHSFLIIFFNRFRPNKIFIGKKNENTGYHNIHGTYVTANHFTSNNVVLFFVSDLKKVYYNNY